MSLAFNANASSGAAVAPDSNLKIEKLPNGFTVAVFKNQEPPRRCSMRLLVKSGSAFENEDERGLAHFIEHMAFNGTKNFPSGAMTEYFQRLGMAFGSDTNAHTSFTETVYKLELPEVSEKLLGESMLLLRDYADGMLFEQSFIDSERSVVLAELAARDDANYRRAVRESSLVLGGTKFPERMPIGLEGVIKKSNREKFVKFYRENYRPDNMVLVVVGDVDAGKIFELAKKHFGGFAAPDAPARAFDIGVLDGKNGGFGGEELDVKIDAMGIPNITSASASLSFVRPVEGSLDSLENRFISDKMNLLGYILNARMQRAADAPAAKITGGGAYYYDYASRMLVFSASCDAPVGAGSAAMEELFRQLLSMDSISESEVANAKKKIFDLLQTAINGKHTRKNRALASEITSAFSDGITFVSPEDDMRLTKLAIENCTAAELCALFKKIVSQSRARLFVADSAELPNAAAAAAKLYKKARGSVYGAGKFEAPDIVFSSFSGSGEIIGRRVVEKLGIVQIKFQNGVALNLKKTDFTKDEVLVNAAIGKGILSVPIARPEYFAAAPAVLLGGTRFQPAADINAAVNLLKMNVGVRMSGGSLSINGSSNTRDCATMLRYIATVINDAGFREDALANLQNAAEAFYKNYENEPSSRLKFLSGVLLEKGIAAIPGNFENFKRYTMRDFEAWLRPILQNAYLEISIVGDFDMGQIEKIAAQTFGAMPPRQASLGQFDTCIQMRAGGEKIAQTYLATTEPRSLACCVWRAPFGADMRKMRIATVLSAVLDDILRKDVREGEGNVYSPFAFYSNLMWLDGAGMVCAATFVEPSYNARLLKTLRECGGKLAERVSRDEFERAKIPIVKSLKASERNNRYWLSSVMAKSQAYPILIEMALNRVEFYEAVSLGDVAEMARDIFRAEPVYLSVMPEKASK